VATCWHPTRGRLGAVSAMTGCQDCHADSLLWSGGKPAGPCRPGHERGRCIWHDKRRQIQNGGLPEPAPRALDQLLHRYEQESERAWAQWRGVADRLGWEDVMVLEGERRKAGR